MCAFVTGTRALDFLEDACAALVVFSCNGIGMVEHDDRLRILAEAHRVLRPGGWFLFSSHNLRFPRANALFRVPEILDEAGREAGAACTDSSLFFVVRRP